VGPGATARLAGFARAEYNPLFARKLLEARLQVHGECRVCCGRVKQMGGFFQPIFFASIFRAAIFNASRGVIREQGWTRF
jgi:hypothetical protein